MTKHFYVITIAPTSVILEPRRGVGAIESILFLPLVRQPADQGGGQSLPCSEAVWWGIAFVCVSQRYIRKMPEAD